MRFSHPLARDAKVWPARSSDGTVKSILVIVTTLELEPESKKFKKDKIERLSGAAQEFIAEQSPAVESFLLMSRVKDWHDETF
jgi:hypothetical protein